jgi:DNA mismatch repair protein MutL
LSATDAVILQELLPDFSQLGFYIEPFGKQAFVIQGTPADMEQGNELQAIEQVLEQYKHFSSEINFSKRERLIRSLSIQQAIKPGTSLQQPEMKQLVEDLFACLHPNVTPAGNPVYIEFKKEYLEQLFRKTSS